jgi:hypothetical protein
MERRSPSAAQFAHPSEGYDDVEFSTATAQDLLLDLLLPGQKIHTSQTLSFAAGSRGLSE